MNFQVAEAFPVPRAGELCYSLEEQFVIHPLHIESVFDNWRQPGTRNGRRGEPHSIARTGSRGGVSHRIAPCDLQILGTSAQGVQPDAVDNHRQNI